MSVWRYRVDVNHYQVLSVVNDSDRRLLIDHFHGKPFPGDWEPFPVYYPTWEELMVGMSEQEKALWTPGKHEILPRGDFPRLSAVPVFSEKAVNALFPLIEPSVQILPLACEEDSLYLINVIDVVDCVDKEHSEFKYFRNGGIMRITHHVFKKEAIRDKHIFKIPEFPVTVYVSDTFKAMVEDKGLKGLRWKPLP